MAHPDRRQRAEQYAEGRRAPGDGTERQCGAGDGESEHPQREAQRGRTGRRGGAAGCTRTEDQQRRSRTRVPRLDGSPGDRTGHTLA